MTKRTKTIIKLLISIVIFGGMVIIGQVYDLQFLEIIGAVAGIYYVGSYLWTLLSGIEQSGGDTMTYNCPHCNELLSIDDMPAGKNKTFPCPKCGQMLKT